MLAMCAGGAMAQETPDDPYAALRAPGVAAYEAGDFARAYTLFEGVIEAIPASDPAERADAAFSLAILAHSLAEPLRALEWLDRGFALQAEAQTPAANYANYLNYAGTISLEAGENERAIAYLRRAIEALPETADTLDARGSTFNALANALNASGRHYEASERRRNALAAYMALYGLDHAYVGIVLEGLASDVGADGHIGQAIDARRDALRIALSTREPGDLSVVTLAGVLADQIAADGDPAGLIRVADIVQDTAGNTRHSARILSEIATRSQAAGDATVSADLHQRAYRAAQADPDTPDDHLATYMLNRAIGVQSADGYAVALPLLEEHHAFVRRMDGEPGLRTAAASERVWTALFRLARFAQAEANARERLEALTARADFPAIEIGRAYENLALSIHEQYRPNDAGPVFARALEILDRTDGAEGILASLLDAYAIHLVYNADRDEALAIARRNVALRAELFGEASAEYARGLNTLAYVQRRNGMTYAALESLAGAEAIYDGLGPSMTGARTQVMLLRGQILYEQGQVAQAESVLADADLLIDPSQANQRRVWHTRMGHIRRTQGRLTEALFHFNEDLASSTAQRGEQARANAFPLLEIAKTLRMQDNLTEAEAMARRVLALHAAYGVTTGSDVGIAWGELAAILSAQDRHDEALQASEQSNILTAPVWPRGTQRRALQDFNHGMLLMAAGEYQEAEQQTRLGIGDFRSIEGHSPVFLGTMMNALGYLLEQQGAYWQAAEAYREGLDLRAGRLTNDNPALASGRAFLARMLIDALDEPAEGLALFRAASRGLVEGIVLRAGTAADEGADGVEFAQKDAFFTAHLEALWTNAHPPQ
ncbi:hypothetical protein L2D01_10515 [Hyphomonadaceae bacterium ML37]|nr:hypothetical protein L2D01_10515 [Hyphomonadaceae bacterium ML37]